MPTEPKPDPLRARIEAILMSSYSQFSPCADDEMHLIADFDPDKTIDALAALVGPLVAACRAIVGASTPYVSAWEFDPYEYPEAHPETLHAEIVAALAAIDESKDS
jgi:galactose-1-phosphate uridylyltransferase